MSERKLTNLLILGAALSWSCSSPGTGTGGTPPSITSFTADKASIAAGESAQLTGVFTGGAGVITPGDLPATSGVPVTVAPAETTTYTLTVTSAAGHVLRTASVEVTAAASPHIASFTADKASIAAGESAQLTGVFTGGAGVITPGDLPVTSGVPVTVTPAATTTYTLTVTGGSDSVFEAATVEVTAAPPSGQLTVHAMRAVTVPGPGDFIWSTGEPTVICDQGFAGDLVGFLRLTSTSQLVAYASQDAGASWSWVEGTGPQDLLRTPAVVVQDGQGKVHLLSRESAYDEVRYTRLALTRDGGGHVTGFQLEASFALPMSAHGDVHLQLAAVTDGTGAPGLVWAAYDDPYAAGGTLVRGRIQLGRSKAGLEPAGPGDFGDLAGAAGTTVAWTSPADDGDPNLSTHNNTLHMAQHPASRDLWLQWGPTDTFDTSKSNGNPLQRMRLVPSGQGWAVGAPVVVDSLARSGQARTPQSLSVSASPNAVWFLRFNAQDGLVIDRADAAGAVATAALPSPLTTPESLGSVVLEVAPSEDEAWLGGWLSTDASGGDGFVWGHWDGAAWTFRQDAVPGGLGYNYGTNYGVGRSSGWSHGLVVVFYDQTSPGGLYLGDIHVE